MFRFFVVPVTVGILAFSFVYYVTPEFTSESDAVSVVAEAALYLSNSMFASMPPVIASYIADLNLLTVALTVGLLFTIVIQLLVIIVDTFRLVINGMIAIFRKDPIETRPPDLPSLDIDARNINSRPGKEILGGGFDSLERD